MKKIKTVKTAFLLALTLLITAVPFPEIMDSVQAAVKLSNPAINYETVTWTHPETGETITEEDTKITWDTIWFGSYPQAEVMTSKMVRIAWSGQAFYEDDRQYLEDDGLYYELENAKGWNESNEITIRGTKYRRMQWKDTAMAKLYYNKSLGGEDVYIKKTDRWSNDTEYRYFAYQPIRWRVLSTDGKTALLLPDSILDAFGYRRKASGKWTLDARWEKSIFRDWLNGYKTTADKDVCMASGDFIHTAFSKKERKKIAITKLVNKDNSTYGTDAGKNTKDKVFLLSEEELFGKKAKEYGILQLWTGIIRFYPDPTGYAEASYKMTGSHDNILTRTPGKSGNTMLLAHNLNYKLETNEMNQKGIFYIQPAITLDLSANKLWDYAGAVEGRSLVSDYYPYPTGQIRITGNTDTLLAGRKVKLGVEEMTQAFQKSDIIWSCSNTEYATVSSRGVVKAKKAGIGKTVTITARVKGTNQVKDTRKIKIVKDSVKSIHLSSPKGKTIFAETSIKLSAKVKTTGKTAGKALDWSSSNEKYATVSPTGVVTAKKAGIGKTVTITAKAADQSGTRATYKMRIVKDAILKLELLTPKVRKIGYSDTAAINVRLTKKSGTTTGYYAARQLKWSDDVEFGTFIVMPVIKGTVKTIGTKKDAGKTFKVTVKAGKKKATTTFKVVNKPKYKK